MLAISNNDSSNSESDFNDHNEMDEILPFILSNDDERILHQARIQCAPVANADVNSVENTYQGFLLLWQRVVLAETEQKHEKAWKNLITKFEKQRRILMYFNRIYMPLRTQWARYYIRIYRNFGIRVTFGTEANNNNVKSYLLHGMNHLYRLVEALQNMLADQERDFTERCALDEVHILQEYYGPSFNYMRHLRTTVSSKALEFIVEQQRKMLAFIPIKRNIHPKPIGTCDTHYTISTELGIPCCYTFCAKIKENVPLKLWDVHHYWHLNASTTINDPYRQILNPKIATSRRGRPRNQPQAVSGILGSGNTIGHRASGQRLQPSIRRHKSQWELISNAPNTPRVLTQKQAVGTITNTAASTIANTAAGTIAGTTAGRTGRITGKTTVVTTKCGRCGQIGHRKTNKACPLRRNNTTSPAPIPAAEAFAKIMDYMNEKPDLDNIIIALPSRKSPLPQQNDVSDQDEDSLPESDPWAVYLRYVEAKQA
jgi:hypothetical protein